MPQATSQASLAPGTLLVKRYRIEELIGSGGYASVYRATDLTFGYERAIKEVHDADQGVRNQFRLEAELLINTKHPNVPHGYNMIEDRGRMYLVMEYIRGKDLEELLIESLTQHNRPLDEAQVLRWAIDICDALNEMHHLQVPVIHRDIKPANIKVTTEGRPVLIDFGLAKLQRAGRPTMTAAQGVSPGFAPPEQYMARGRTDGRTDVYGLGATLYACLTGRDPAEAPSRLLAQTGAKGSGGAALVAPRRLNPNVSEATDRLILKALELSPSQRQQSAAQLSDEMRAALKSLEGAQSASTLVMGTICPRCHTQNRPNVARCVNCGASLLAGAPEDTGKRTIASALPPDSSAKRPIVATPGAARGAGKATPAKPPRPTTPPAPDPRTGQFAAVGARTAQQPAIATPRPAAAAAAMAAPVVAQAATAATSAAATPAAGRASGRAAQRAAEMAAAPQPTQAVAVAERADVAAASLPQDGAWVRFGATPIGGFGKAMLALATVEVLWGTIVLVLGSIAIATQGHPFPTVQFALVWAVVVLLVSLLGGQALSRPVYRRGTITSLRRGLQGTVLVLWTLITHAVALWGAQIFAHDQGNFVLAIISFMLFGLIILVVGVLALVNLLG